MAKTHYEKETGESARTKGELFASVRKRDGRVVVFDQDRITNAVYRAMEVTGEGDLPRDPRMVSDRVVKALLKKFPTSHIPSIEEIQDIVEENLILSDFPKTAKSYILYRQQRTAIRERQRHIPERIKKFAADSKKYFRNSLAEFVYYRSYSRWIEEEGRRETWIETIDRYVQFMKENLGERLTDTEYSELREAILNQEVMPSMRLMWSAGKAARKTNVSAYNCSYIAPAKLEDFSEIMYLSMCGTGVGFSVESQTVQQLPLVQRQIGKKLPTHTIEDSKEGWCEALTLGLKTWYAGKDIDFDYSRLRPAGAVLKTMGGKSSGPDPLRSLLTFARAKIITKQGKRLSNLDVHDIICKIGEVVVAGGVRRSALISLSDLDDGDMRGAKTGQFYLTNPQRSMANNSAAYNEKPSATEFLREWLALAESGSGERGIFNRGGLHTQLPARRWKTFQKHATTAGTNPCVTADTWITTSEGARQVKDLIKTPYRAAVNGKNYFSGGFFETGIKPIFEIKTHRGFSFKATDNHTVLVIDYRSRKIQRKVWKAVKDINIGDEIVLHDHKMFSWKGRGAETEGWLLGNLLGDGNIEKNGKANLDYWGINQQVMMRYALSAIHSTVDARNDMVGHVAKTGYGRVQSVGVGRLGIVYGMGYQKKHVTEEIEKSSSDFYKGFLRGWFDADGSVQGNRLKGTSVRLSSNSLPDLHAAQRMLARLGIISTVYENRRRASLRRLPDGQGGSKEYFCEANHELVISRVNMFRFAEAINFTDPEKKLKLKQALSSYSRIANREDYSSRVVSISPAGTEKVYDCAVEGVHAFDGNGAFLHNCGEIILRSKQFCNLTEVVARAEDTQESLLKKIRLATILGTYQSTLTHFPFLSKEWKKNCEEERLLGVSITGQWDSKVAREPEVLTKLKTRALEVNKEYAKRFGINVSTAITCIKPSGTVSQLVDASSGMHPRHSKYYIRRIRISATDKLFHMLKDQKFPYHPEVGQVEGFATTYVLEFPVKAPAGSTFRNDLSAPEQLEYWRMVKERYTEHNPSVTVSVGEREWVPVADWLYKNWDMIGGLSFLPREDHVYRLAPYEEVDEKRYRELLTKLPEIDFSQIIAYEEEDMTIGTKELACVGGICEIDFSAEAGFSSSGGALPTISENSSPNI